MAKVITRPAKRIFIADSASVVGRAEYEGPLGDCFDIYSDSDDTFGMKTWEKAESEMQRLALSRVLSSAGKSDSDIDALFAGDLLNQCAGSNYGLIGFDIPYFGLYGACSTAAEGLAIASLMCGSSFKRCAVVTSSHNCSAERQFRYPLEYGGQRTPNSQWTVTGAGAFLVTSDTADVDLGGRTVQIDDVLPGCVVDGGITDINNMGAAMAPAAIDTLERYFNESGRNAAEFDLIVTGDLGREGTAILRDMLKNKGHDITSNHVDCGIMIYNIDAQDMHAGGSGCGCSAVVMASHVIKNLRAGVYSDILFIGTGALMSPLKLQQGESIPGIAHLVHITSSEGF